MIEQYQNHKNNQNNNEESFRLLKEISSESRLNQRELARKMGISLGKTNYLIKELAKKGLVKIKIFSKKDNKLNRISYILTPKGIKEKTSLTLHFLKRKQEEYEFLKREWERLAERQHLNGFVKNEEVKLS